jgi:GNAT superfamily N-acetyltransferase
MSVRFGDPEPLDATHTVDGFDCGVESLNVWLVEHARGAVASGSARVFVTVDREQARVCGYYALAAAAITHQQATERARKGQPRHPIPAVLLARLAVDASVQSRGIGAWILHDAMRRALSASEAVGMRVLLVHALDDAARRFYERWGFEPSPTDPFNLQMLFKDIRRSLES